MLFHQACQCYSYSHSENTSTMDRKPAQSFYLSKKKPLSPFMQRPIIIQKSIQTVFLNPLNSFLMTLNGFNISPVQGISLLAGSICPVQALELLSVPTLSAFYLKRNGSWASGGMEEATMMVGDELEQDTKGPYVDETSQAVCSSVALGPRNSVCRGSFASLWFPLGCALAAHWTSRTVLQPAEDFLGGKGTLHGREECLQCDTSKNRHNTVNINNETKMSLNKLGNLFFFLFFFLIEIQRK